MLTIIGFFWLTGVELFQKIARYQNKFCLRDHLPHSSKSVQRWTVFRWKDAITETSCYIPNTCTARIAFWVRRVLSKKYAIFNLTFLWCMFGLFPSHFMDITSKIVFIILKHLKWRYDVFCIYRFGQSKFPWQKQYSCTNFRWPILHSAESLHMKHETIERECCIMLSWFDRSERCVTLFNRPPFIGQDAQSWVWAVPLCFFDHWVLHRHGGRVGNKNSWMHSLRSWLHSR